MCMRSTNERLCSTLFFLATTLATAGAATGAAHPLDPLDENEILAAAQILLDGGAAQPGAVFQGIDLREPAKELVLSGAPTTRMAVVNYRQAKRSFRAIVDLDAGTFTPPVEIPRSQGQLGLTIQEILDFSFAFESPAFLSALASRGIDTPEELANVLITPLTPGAFGLPEEQRRIVKAQMYFVDGAAINLYARPIEGLQAIMDLDRREVLEVRDTGVVPVPAETHEFDEAAVDATVGLRPELRPIRITQPEGVNFALDGHLVEWQNWRFHLRADRRTGTVISLVTYDDRPVLYQGGLSEIFVPYQDPDSNWFYRTFMDAGEFGFGTLASSLVPGLDLPENAMLLDALISAALPDPDLPVIPLLLEDVVGVFERLTGNAAWRHAEFLTGGYEGRAAVELVVRMIAQAGNYDYVVDWVFTQAGSIRVDVFLTGIDVPKAVTIADLQDPGAGEATEHGALIAPYLVGVYHSHHFAFRLDADVDGPVNSFQRGELVRSNVSGSARKSVWKLEEEVLESELDARLDDDDVWRVVNPAQTNAMGYPTSFVLESHGGGEPLLKKKDYRRAGFIEHDLWVTVHDPDELYAAGDTPNQNPGSPGLPVYAGDDESIENADLVLWHTLTFHHVTAAEDFPVLPLEHASFELVPANFFDRNPALDLRRAPFEVVP